jgi:hypothetical protein
MKTDESRWSGLSFDKAEIQLPFLSILLQYHRISSPANNEANTRSFYNGYTKSFEGRYCEEYRSNDCFPP